MKTRIRRNRGRRQWPWKRLPPERKRGQRPVSVEFQTLTTRSHRLRVQQLGGVYRL